MKKFLLFAAAAVAAIAASAQTYHVWNMGELFEDTSNTEDFVANAAGTAWDLKHNMTIDGLTFYSKYVDGAEKQSVWTLDNCNKTADGGLYSFTKRAKMGGAAGWEGAPTDEDPVGLPAEEWTPITRIMSFEVDGPTDITLYFESASSSDPDRMTIIYAGNAGNEVFHATGGAMFPRTFHYDGEATTIYIGGSGLNYYAVITSEYTPELPTYALYTYMELADGSENPNGVTNFGTISRTPKNSTNASEDEYEEGTIVTLSANPVENFKVSYWEVDGDILNENTIKVTMDMDHDVYCYVEYVDPANPVPGYLEPNTVQGAKIRNWANETTARGVCNLLLSAGIDEPTANDIKAAPWPEAGVNVAYDFPAMVSNAKGTGVFSFLVRVTEAGEYNLLVSASDKGKTNVDPAGKISVQVFKGEDTEGELVAEGSKKIVVTGQDWQYYENRVNLDNALETGLHFVQIKVGQTDTGRTANVLYACMGIGDNYGNWAEKNPAMVEAVVADKAEGEVRYYNLQGIQVAPNTKGLLILSNGTKVLNK